MGALFDELKRESFGFLVFVLLHHFEAVDDRTDRAD
jgi:hypothetical protein